MDVLLLLEEQVAHGRWAPRAARTGFMHTANSAGRARVEQARTAILRLYGAGIPDRGAWTRSHLVRVGSV